MNLINKPVIRIIDELSLVGFRVVCTGERYVLEIPQASKRLADRLHEIKNVINKDLQYGAFMVDAKTVEDDGYWVMVEVESFENLPEDMDRLVIPSQKYAAAKYQGTNKGIFNAYEELHKWIDGQGHRRLVDRWHVEIFESWMNPDNLSVELLDTIE